MVVIIKINVLWIYQGRRAEIDLQLKKDHIGREEAESKQKKAWLWSVLNGDVLSLIQELYFSDVFNQIWFKYISERKKSLQPPCFIHKWWITSNLQHLIYVNEIQTRCIFISLLKEIYNRYYCDYLRVDLARKSGRFLCNIFEYFWISFHVMSQM